MIQELISIGAFALITIALQTARAVWKMNFLMFDTMAFFSCACAYFLGVPYLVAFVIATSIIGAVFTAKFSPGNLLNIMLFIACPLLARQVMADFMVGTMVAQFIYGIIYVPVRTSVLGGSMHATVIKAVSNIFFVALYLSMFGDALTRLLS